MDTRLLGPKGMNGVKILSRHQTTSSDQLPTMHQPSCRLRHRSDTQLGSSPTHTHDSPPSEQQVHSKVSLRRGVNAVYGVEWRVFEPTIKAGKRHDAQAACEPGCRGCGGVPVHPARLHTHRTSPAQALLTILTETCATFDLLSHCHLVCVMSDVH
jgi:hypothetical protein